MPKIILSKYKAEELIALYKKEEEKTNYKLKTKIFAVPVMLIAIGILMTCVSSIIACMNKPSDCAPILIAGFCFSGFMIAIDPILCNKLEKHFI